MAVPRATSPFALEGVCEEVRAPGAWGGAILHGVGEWVRQPRDYSEDRRPASLEALLKTEGLGLFASIGGSLLAEWIDPTTTTVCTPVEVPTTTSCGCP